jgi:ABC-type multidrug transport system ATPase subunit
MKITLTDAGKRFNRDWIFRHLSYEFFPGISYAITGPNGSGKSTLFQLIAGSMMGSEGQVLYELQDKVPDEQIYRHIAITAPYLELIEEMTLAEFLRFHQTFKPFLSSLAIESISTIVGLGKELHKQIRYYSSGMKQRVKLAQAIFSDTPVLLLDEPCTNLDEEGMSLYHQLIEEYCPGRLVIVSSNDEQEYGFCGKRINILDYKQG